MLRYFFCIAGFLGISIGAEALNCIDSLRLCIQEETKISERIRLQYQLLDHRDSQSSDYILETQRLNPSQTERFECAYQLAYYYYRLSPNAELAAFWVDQMLKIKTENKLLRTLLELMKAEADYLSEKDAFKRYLVYQHQAGYFLTIQPEDEDIHHHLRYLYTASRYARWQNKLDSSFVFIEQANTYLTHKTSDILIYHVKREFANLYHMLEENGKALQLMQETFEQVNHHQVYYDLAYYHFYMGKFLGTIREPEDAIDHLDKCVDLCLSHQLPNFTGGAYINLGVAYVQLKQYDKAEDVYNLALEHYGNHSSLPRKNTIAVLINIANVIQASGDHQRAMNELQNAYAFAMESGHQAYAHAAQTSMTTVYWKWVCSIRRYVLVWM